MKCQGRYTIRLWKLDEHNHANVRKLKPRVQYLSKAIDFSDDVYAISCIKNTLQNAIKNVKSTDYQECNANKEQKSANFSHYFPVVIMLCGASLDFSDKYDNKVSNFTVRGIATSQRVDVVNITRLNWFLYLH